MINNIRHRSIPARSLKTKNNISISSSSFGITGEETEVTANEFYTIDVQTVTTSNHPLSGLSAINGYTLVSGDLVLVQAQNTAYENGIYGASSGNWVRINQDPNFNSRIIVRGGDYSGTEWRFEDPYKRIDIDSIEYTQVHPKYSLIDTEITLNSTQLTNIHTTPITIVSAQGANTIIEPISCVVSLNFNSTPYTGSAQLRLSQDVGGLTYIPYFISSNNLVISAADYHNLMERVSNPSSDSQMATNTDLVIDTGGVQILTGNSTITFRLTYRILDV